MSDTEQTIKILAIESSCDETAAAVVVNGRDMRSNVISSQIALHTLYGGVVPEIASRKHIEKINQVIAQALSDFLLIFAIFFKKDSGTRAYVMGSILATLVMTAAMVVANFVYAIPLYAKFAHFDINQIFGASEYLLAMVVPFNLLEGAIFAVSFAIIFVAIKSILENMSKKTKVSH